MKLEYQNILFFTRTMNLGGTENVVLQLCEIFKPLVNKIFVCSSGGVNVNKLEKMNIKHYEIIDIEDKNPKTIITNCKRIKKIVDEDNITVIHTHHRMAAFYVKVLGLDKHCKFINTSHNTFYDKILLTRYSYKNCRLIACGEMVKRNLVKEYGFKDVTVIHNAIKPFIDSRQLDHTLKRDKEKGAFLVGNIGRLSMQKGMEYYIQAIPKVINKYPHVHFYIVGSGEDEKKLKEMSKGLPISFMGYRSDVQNLMSQLDLVVLSSIWEGFPLTPIEAFSVGKTIVATRVDGTVEIVKNGVNGLLVKPKDADDISKKIIWMIEHPEEKKLMELKAKETYENDFSFDILSKSYIDYYERI